MPTHLIKLALLAAIVLAELLCLSGCRAKAPIYVWRPALVATPRYSRIALAPVAGQAQVSQAMELAMLNQRPTARADLALLTTEQLAQVSPVRLVSTASLSNDLIALQAAKAAGADIVLCGQVIDYRLDFAGDEQQPKPAEQNMNQVFFQRLGAQNQNAKDAGYHMAMSWTVLDTHTGKTLGSHQFKIQSKDIADRYPDLQNISAQPAEQLVAACARETWKTLSPVVEKDLVRLAVPLFQPGSWRVWRGVRAAKKGQWQTAEMYWQKVADGWLPASAAHHNLAIAKAAREDFTGAKQDLQNATGIMSRRLPQETLVWLDHNHKLYCQAHQLPEPVEGWSFKNPYGDSQDESYTVQAVDSRDLPWWSDIPGLNLLDTTQDKPESLPAPRSSEP